MVPVTLPVYMSGVLTAGVPAGGAGSKVSFMPFANEYRNCWIGLVGFVVEVFIPPSDSSSPTTTSSTGAVAGSAVFEGAIGISHERVVEGRVLWSYGRREAPIPTPRVGRG